MFCQNVGGVPGLARFLHGGLDRGRDVCQKHNSGVCFPKVYIIKLIRSWLDLTKQPFGRCQNICNDIYQDLGDRAYIFVGLEPKF